LRCQPQETGAGPRIGGPPLGGGRAPDDEPERAPAVVGGPLRITGGGRYAVRAPKNEGQKTDVRCSRAALGGGKRGGVGGGRQVGVLGVGRGAPPRRWGGVKIRP